MMCDSHIFTHVKNVEHLIKCKTIAIYNLFWCSNNVFFLQLIISLTNKSTFFCFLLQNVMFCITLIVKIVEHRKVLLWQILLKFLVKLLCIYYLKKYVEKFLCDWVEKYCGLVYITLWSKSCFRKIGAETCFAAHFTRDEFLRFFAYADRRENTGSQSRAKLRVLDEKEMVYFLLRRRSWKGSDSILTVNPRGRSSGTTGIEEAIELSLWSFLWAVLALNGIAFSCYLTRPIYH